VTQALWTLLMGLNPAAFQTGAGAYDRPVERVSWLDAVRFCNALSAKQGLRPAYTVGAGDASGVPDDLAELLRPEVAVDWTADGFRLPTEAEWECAARAGTTHVYAGGDDVDAVAWHRGNSGSTTHPVGRKHANAWGLHDMSGNVWEWCHDLHGAYPDDTAVDPIGPAFGPDRVRRGGSWGSESGSARVANRKKNDPGHRHVYLGFRLSRTIPWRWTP
jgi:formylglycine-generating enzyme required for sulfatase activity